LFYGIRGGASEKKVRGRGEDSSDLLTKELKKDSANKRSLQKIAGASKGRGERKGGESEMPLSGRLDSQKGMRKRC